jgi:hypothetical protein
VVVVLIPTCFQNTTRTKQHFDIVTDDLKLLSLYLERFYDTFFEYPLVLTDPRFVGILSDNPDLLNRLLPPEQRQPPESEYEAAFFPYFIYSLRPGTKGPRSRATWDYRIASGITINPIYLATADPDLAASLYGTYDDGKIVEPSTVVSRCRIFADRAEIFLDNGPPDVWYWDVHAPRHDVVPEHIPLEQIQLALATVRAAEIVTPLLEQHPDAALQIRAYSNNPANVAEALAKYDPAWFAPFADILGISGPDDVPPFEDEDLTRAPGYLFSYDSLRVVTAHYCRDLAVANSLCAKLDAAHAAEMAGQANAKKTLIKNFQNQVRGQVGKTLTQDRARVLLALSGTL